MSPSYRQTRVEKEDQGHPGLQRFVEGAMRLRVPNQQISDQVAEKFGVTIRASTLNDHWTLRFNPDLEAERAEYRKAKAQVDVLVSECGADPAKDATQILAMLVRTAIFKQREALEEADVMKLLAEERKRQEVEIQRGQLQVAVANAETARKEAEVRAAKVEAQRRQVDQEIDEEAERKGGSLSKEDINRIRERVYGIGEASPGS